MTFKRVCGLKLTVADVVWYTDGMSKTYVYRAVHDTTEMGIFAYLDNAMRTLDRVATTNSLPLSRWEMPQPHLENTDGETILGRVVGDSLIPQYITKHIVQE